MTGHRGLGFYNNHTRQVRGARHSVFTHFPRSFFQMTVIWEIMLLILERQGHRPPPQTRHFLLVGLSSLGFVLTSL